jgi:hypothetical protein
VCNNVLEGDGGPFRLGGGGGGGPLILPDWLDDWFTDEEPAPAANDNATRDEGRKRYHKRCDEKPPPGLDKCELARWLAQRARDCIKLRKDYMDRWGDTYQGHYDQIRQRQKELERWERLVRENCCGK